MGIPEGFKFSSTLSSLTAPPPPPHPASKVPVRTTIPVLFINLLFLTIYASLWNRRFSLAGFFLIRTFLADFIIFRTAG
jgi:hypothetical protein